MPFAVSIAVFIELGTIIVSADIVGLVLFAILRPLLAE